MNTLKEEMAMRSKGEGKIVWCLYCKNHYHLLVSKMLKIMLAMFPGKDRIFSIIFSILDFLSFASISVSYLWELWTFSAFMKVFLKIIFFGIGKSIICPYGINALKREQHFLKT